MTAFKEDMEDTSTVFIAREYMFADDFGGVRIDEEAVFSSFKDAQEFLKTLHDEKATDKDLILFRTEILEYKIGNTDSFERKWTYSIKGELLEEVTRSDNVPEEEEIKHTYKYKIGDIVYILPKLKSKFSPCIRGTYGVIVEDQDEQTEKKNDQEYTIYYITDNGFMNHLHVTGKSIIPIEASLPSELEFLHLFSDYLRKDGKLNDMLVSEVITEEVFVKNIKTFNFSKRKILDAHTADIK